MDPVVAARVAKEAGVKKLIYVHITPPLTNKTTEELYLKGVSDIFNGEIILGGGSHEIQVKTKILEISFISYFENFFKKNYYMIILIQFLTLPTGVIFLIF